jgi:hypothetical protein
LSSAFDQRSGAAAFVLQFDDFQQLGSVIEKVRVLAKVGGDNFL